jgi:hypothetical protein
MVRDAQNKVELYHAPRDAIEKLYKRPCSHKKCRKDLNVAVVTAPCNGFGDVVFATKFARYLKNGLTKGSKPYSKNVSIITPTPDMFHKLGVRDIDIYELKGGQAQCRRLQAYNRPRGLPKQDIIFIAPLMIGFDPNYRDVKALLKESTPFNTIFLSEYQDYLDKGFDFTTGVGDGYSGMLFDGVKPSKRLKKLGKWPYAMAYLAKDAGPKRCLNDFVKMIVAKYHKTHPHMQIVVPGWAAEKIQNSPSMQKFIKKYYDTGSLKIRGDIFPVPRKDMLSLIKYSIPDILVTGDQSVTDVIDCCQNKNIWYQTVSWKIPLAKAMADELPQRFLSKPSTSCGTLKAIRWNNKGTTFKKHHDFRRLARHQLDVIFRAASEARDPKTVTYRYLGQLKKSAGKKALLTAI